jgi:hypothetical protein
MASRTNPNTENPDPVDGFPHRLGVVAAVASCPEVIQLQPQVRSHFNRDLMIGMQMLLTLAEPFPQFSQNLLDRRRTQLKPPEVCHYARLPSAINTPPLVADEAENAQPAVVGVIAALGRSTSPLIVLPLFLPFVLQAIAFAVT